MFSKLQLAASLAVAVSLPLQADVIFFKNGDQLTGTLVSMQDGKLEFKTSAIGTVTIAMTEVRSFSTDNSAELHFADGTVVKKAVQAEAGEAVAIKDAPLLSGQPVALNQLKTINPKPEPQPEWVGKLSTGLNIERGNTIRDDAHLDVAVSREGKKDRIRLSVEYDEKRQEDVKTGKRSTSKRRYAFAGHYDYFVNGDTYLYGNTKAEKETTANLDLRFALGSGVGYRWWNTDKSEFDTELGLSWVNETFTDDSEDRDYISSRVSWKYHYQFTDATRLFHNAEWLPSLENSRDQLVNTETGVTSKLNSFLSLEAKVKYRWDQTPADGKEKDDTTYILGLGVNF